MNFKTTLVLFVLVIAGGALFWFGPSLAPLLHLAPQPVSAAGAGTLNTLEKELASDRLTRIEVRSGERTLVFERGLGGVWTLPGHWPTRQAEVDQLVALLTSLRSRFAPVPLGANPDLNQYGLERPPVTVFVHAGGKDYRLSFGEEPGASNRFSRPTYVRIDDRPEVVRLAPGLLDPLRRPQDYYQQRRLFASERVAKEGTPEEKVEQLAASGIKVTGGGSGYDLARTGDLWQLREPVKDRPDPDKLKAIVSAVPDIWAEQFVDKNKDLAELGLKDPEQTLRVTQPSGDVVTLQIGKQSQMKVRKVMRPAPSFGGPPMPPQEEMVHEEYRYAKLHDNDQVFEIRADKLKDIFIPVASLRDPRLARFSATDARRLEIQQGDQEILLVKENGTWKLEKPFKAEAESSKVTELLDKLSGLEARDQDILDKADPKTVGLEKPSSTIQVTVEETKAGTDAKDKKTETFTFVLGKDDVEKSKLYVRMEGRERVNAVDDSLLKLVARPALAYRGRRVFDFNSADVAKIEIQHEGDPFTLEPAKNGWRLAAPVQADVDTTKADQLVGDLSRLEAVDYVTEKASALDLKGRFGLEPPALSATITFKDDKKPARKLQVGKQREGRPEFFARLDDAPAVFAVKKELHDALDQKSLAYRPLQLWQLTPGKITDVRVYRGGQEYQLKQEGQSWRITGPFDAPAAANLAGSLVKELDDLRADKYVTHVAKDLKAYGLDSPALRVTARAARKEKAAADPKEKTEKPASTEHVLLVGKAAEGDAGARYAKLGDSEGIFVLSSKTVAALDQGALDLLDRKLLTLDPQRIQLIHSTGPEGPLGIQRKGADWQVVESAAPPFAADPSAMVGLLGLWSNLRAERFAAYGPKADLASYGLDKPAVTIKVTLQSAPADGKPAQPAEHTLVLGKPVEPGKGERFARVDNGPGVAVLSAGAVADVTKGYLDFVNRTLLKLNAGSIQGIRRSMGGDTLDVVRREDTWQIVQPGEFRADSRTMNRLVESLAVLQATRVAAYPLKDAQAFGLDEPAAIVTLHLEPSAGKMAQHVLRIGKVADENSGDRFVRVDDSPVAAVIAGDLAKQLLAPPLHFRDRTLARFLDADRIVLERGPRRATFAKVSGTWKLTEPTQADAEQSELEDFLNALARLHADELVTEKAGDLKEYGLDRPVAAWHIYWGDKEVLTLLVGDYEKDGNMDAKDRRAYARLANSDVVFLLDPRLTAKALGEYRTRTLWPPLDATQIERLDFEYPDRGFTLEKVENNWQVVGKPDMKVNADAIRETLDALAGLRAARYVVDTAGDLKLYGLEPPQLTLEIQTRSGKRLLAIGRPEGESRRLYARVREGARSDVFIIDEADANRIVRALPALTR